MRVFWLCLCAAVLSAANAAPVPPPAGSRETEFLRAARTGDTTNVFLVDMFGGLVALPRTFTLMPGLHFALATGVHNESTLRGGVVYLGSMIEQQDGWIDAQSKRSVPSGSTSIEHIGPLRLESYEPGHYATEASILMTDGQQYAWFIADSRLIAKEVALTFMSQTGPNRDFFVSRPESCFDSVIEAGLGASSKDQTLMLRNAPPAGAAGFFALGFKAGDIFEYKKYAKPGELPLAAFERLLRTAPPAGVRIPINRGGKQIVVVIPNTTMARVLPKCTPPAKSP
jgi:hypothetical protein